MKEFLGVLKKSRLFSELSDDELLGSLGCLASVVKNFSKNEVVFEDGECVESVGVILSGEVQTQKTDYEGNVSIVSRLFPADVIAASVCYSKDKRLPFEVVAATDCRVLFLASAMLIRPCKSACVFHARLIQNMLGIIADRNLLLATKIDILTRRTIKEKVLAYLHNSSKRVEVRAMQAKQAEGSAPKTSGTAKNAQSLDGGKAGWFAIPLSRRQMAEYLSINRSALSRQLCLLRDEGILDFNGNSFRLK